LLVASSVYARFARVFIFVTPRALAVLGGAT
jgi:hypothetical protein